MVGKSVGFPKKPSKTRGKQRTSADLKSGVPKGTCGFEPRLGQSLQVKELRRFLRSSELARTERAANVKLRQERPVCPITPTEAHDQLRWSLAKSKWSVLKGWHAV